MMEFFYTVWAFATGLGGLGLLAIAAGVLGAIFIPGARRLCIELAVVAAAGTAIYASGFSAEKQVCDAAALRIELAQTKATLEETSRQLAAAQEIQKLDAERARAAEEALRKNQEAIDATPTNAAACLDRDAVGRLRDVK